MPPLPAPRGPCRTCAGPAAPIPPPCAGPAAPIPPPKVSLPHGAAAACDAVPASARSRFKANCPFTNPTSPPTPRNGGQAGRLMGGRDGAIIQFNKILQFNSTMQFNIPTFLQLYFQPFNLSTLTFHCSNSSPVGIHISQTFNISPTLQHSTLTFHISFNIHTL